MTLPVEPIPTFDADKWRTMHPPQVNPGPHTVAGVRHGEAFPAEPDAGFVPLLPTCDAATGKWRGGVPAYARPHVPGAGALLDAGPDQMQVAMAALDKAASRSEAESRLRDTAPELLAELKGWVENEASMVDDQIKWGAMNGFYSPEQCAQILRTRALIARVEGRS